MCWGRMTSLKPLDFGHSVDSWKTDDNCKISWGKGDFSLCCKQHRKKKIAVLELRISYVLYKKKNTSGAEMGEIIRWSGLCNISICSSSIFLNRGTLLSISKL